MIELKPCPFCGGKATIILIDTEWERDEKGIMHIQHSYAVGCAKCQINAKTYSSNIYQDVDGNIEIKKNGAKEAAEAWNRRADDDKRR